MIEDTREYPKKGQKGMVLMLTFIIMVMLTAIVVAFIYLTSTRTKVLGYDTASHKALGLAEAGIQKAIYYLRYGGGLTDGAGTIGPVNLGDGSYSVVVTKDPSSGGVVKTVTSTGTVSGINRTIKRTVTVGSYQTAYGGGMVVVGNDVTVRRDWNETY